MNRLLNVFVLMSSLFSRAGFAGYFKTTSKSCFSVVENPYQQLPCDCHSSMPGKTAVVLGPLW